MGYDFSVAQELYTSLKPRIDPGEITFVAYSGDYKVVNAANEQGIPATDKSEFRIERLFIKP